MNGKNADELTIKELQEMTVTDRFGKEVPATIEWKRNFLRVSDRMWGGFGRRSDSGEKLQTINRNQE